MAATGQDAGQGSVQVNDTYRKKEESLRIHHRGLGDFAATFRVNMVICMYKFQFLVLVEQLVGCIRLSWPSFYKIYKPLSRHHLCITV